MKHLDDIEADAKSAFAEYIRDNHFIIALLKSTGASQDEAEMMAFDVFVSGALFYQSRMNQLKLNQTKP